MSMSTTTGAPSSWLDIEDTSDFSLRNVPFGVCSIPPLKCRPRCCTAIGSYAVDLSVLAEAGLFDNVPEFSATRAFSRESLNEFMSHPRRVWMNVRDRIIELFTEGGPDDLRSNEALQRAALHKLDTVTVHLPAAVGDYTDFYSSREHATNVGTMFRGRDNALQPNWLHLPVGYHGRSSTVFPSGTCVHRPYGQLQKDPNDPSAGSIFDASRLVDFELEMAFFVGGPSNPAGQRLGMSEAQDRIFGFVLMNDWSARDVQKWEYVPLGPFTSKNFATSISCWIVTTMALEEFTCPTSAETQNDPIPLEYLQDPNYSSFDIKLSVSIQGENMAQPETVCRSNFANLYWNARQQLVHHSVTGCVMQPGDLLASGTISGSDPQSFGSMLELSWKGSREVSLGKSGEVRKFLKDGDTVIMKGMCETKGYGRVGFGECTGKLLPAMLLGQEGENLQRLVPVQKERYADVKLYGYWRSSSTWRVRVALAAKSIHFETLPVHLLKSEQKSTSHVKRNPMAQIPVLECTDTTCSRTIRITQSLAIIEFLEEAFPLRGGTLMPMDPVDRAAVREMAEIVNSGTQPLQNLSVTKKIEVVSDGKVNGREFGKEAIENGLRALETIVVIGRRERGYGGGPFALGGFAPTIADACIVPQLYNARRFDVTVDGLYPTLLKVEEACLVHPWFVPSHPDAQPDAQESSPPAKKTRAE